MDIQQGTLAELGVKISYKNGLIYDLTGKTVRFTLKKRSDISTTDENALITKNIVSHIEPEKGITLIELTTTDTNIPLGIYIADLRVNTSESDPINTPSFEINIVKTITKRVANG